MVYPLVDVVFASDSRLGNNPAEEEKKGTGFLQSVSRFMTSSVVGAFAMTLPAAFCPNREIR